MRALSLLRAWLFRAGFRARRLEAQGRLAEATALYLHAGVKDEAARLFRIRADAEPDPLVRLRLLGQALSLAKDEALSLRRARLALELVQSRALRLTPSELVVLGATLEETGEPGLAAEAYALAGEVDAQARALVSAGAVERLEQVLETERSFRRQSLERETAEKRIRDCLAVGKRREALSVLEAHAANDEKLAAERRELLARRLCGPRVELELDGSVHNVVFGTQVIVGRNDAGIVIASPCVSREHLALRAGARGPEVVDLGSRNATTFAGARLDAPLTVDRALVLLLGGEVELRIERWGERGVSVAVTGKRHLAPLGELSFGPWVIDQSDDTWIEAASERAFYLGRLRADARVQLCRGDELRSELAGPTRIRVPR